MPTPRRRADAPALAAGASGSGSDPCCPACPLSTLCVSSEKVQLPGGLLSGAIWCFQPCCCLESNSGLGVRLSLGPVLLPTLWRPPHGNNRKPSHHRLDRAQSSALLPIREEALAVPCPVVASERGAARSEAAWTAFKQSLKEQRSCRLHHCPPQAKQNVQRHIEWTAQHLLSRQTSPCLVCTAGFAGD